MPQTRCATSSSSASTSPRRRSQAARHGQRVLEALFTHYERRPETIEGFSLPDDPPWRRAADYVAGMADGFALRRAAELRLAID